MDHVNRPRVSVIIPCYNHGDFILEAVDSVKHQSFLAYEIIVVDDGSTEPGTLEILSGLYEKGDVKLIQQQNAGVSSARNSGIAHADGEYILPLDADDRISQGFLLQAVAEMDRDVNTGIVYGHTELFGDKQGLWVKPEFALQDMLFENLIVVSALFRKADWERVGGFREEMVYGWEDWDFWLSIIGLGRRVARLDIVSLHYRILPESRSSRMSFSQKCCMMASLVLRHKGLYWSNTREVLRRFLNPSYRKVSSPRD